MLPSPVNSTPFSVKDILNLEKHHQSVGMVMENTDLTRSGIMQSPLQNLDYDYRPQVEAISDPSMSNMNMAAPISSQLQSVYSQMPYSGVNGKLKLNHDSEAVSSLLSFSNHIQNSGGLQSDASLSPQQRYHREFYDSNSPNNVVAPTPHDTGYGFPSAFSHSEPSSTSSVLSDVSSIQQSINILPNSSPISTHSANSYPSYASSTYLPQQDGVTDLDSSYSYTSHPHNPSSYQSFSSPSDHQSIDFNTSPSQPSDIHRSVGGFYSSEKQSSTSLTQGSASDLTSFPLSGSRSGSEGNISTFTTESGGQQFGQDMTSKSIEDISIESVNNQVEGNYYYYGDILLKFNTAILNFGRN